MMMEFKDELFHVLVISWECRSYWAPTVNKSSTGQQRWKVWWPRVTAGQGEQSQRHFPSVPPRTVPTHASSHCDYTLTRPRSAVHQHVPVGLPQQPAELRAGLPDKGRTHWEGDGLLELPADTLHRLHHCPAVPWKGNQGTELSSLRPSEAVTEETEPSNPQVTYKNFHWMQNTLRHLTNKIFWMENVEEKNHSLSDLKQNTRNLWCLDFTNLSSAK